MLARLGCTYACVGHSERREYHGEDDATVAAKAAAAHRHGLVPIVCVGEPQDVREASEHVAYTLAQLDGSLAGLSAEQVAATVVAYEPVWAIGTGLTCDADDAQEVCAAIRARLAETHGDAVADRVRVLYGGSVKPSNVAGHHGQARHRRRARRRGLAGRRGLRRDRAFPGAPDRVTYPRCCGSSTRLRPDPWSPPAGDHLRRRQTRP